MNENVQEFTQSYKLVRCPICRTIVREDRLGKHKSKIHKIPKKEMAICLICKSFVRVDKLKSHKARVHSWYETDQGKRPALAKISFTIPLEDAESLEHLAWENKMRIEASIRDLIHLSNVKDVQVEVVPP